jgi:hypothetical protein
MTDEDERALDQLSAIFGDKVRRTDDTDGDYLDTDGKVVNDHVEVVVDVVDDDTAVDQDFADRLLAPSDRKWQQRREWRDKDDRRQERQDRWNR